MQFFHLCWEQSLVFLKTVLLKRVWIIAEMCVGVARGVGYYGFPCCGGGTVKPFISEHISTYFAACPDTPHWNSTALCNPPSLTHCHQYQHLVRPISSRQNRRPNYRLALYPCIPTDIVCLTGAFANFNTRSLDCPLCKCLFLCQLTELCWKILLDD